MFTAQATARDMMAKGPSVEIEEIRREVSRIAPELTPGTNEDAA